MSATQTWILRSSIVLGMVAAVVTILYFTPMPEHHFKSCDRPCHELDWPMICRIKLTIEEYQSLSRSCLDCPQNVTHCRNKNCISLDGTRRPIYTANRQLPGPIIQVCQNDILLVDVSNRISGQEISLHWRGQHQKGTQVMDGVPMITQCPIASYTTFQYKFRASTPGTHLWHAHSSSLTANGIFGALIVRQPDVIEPQKRLYDVDNKEHVVVITEMEKQHFRRDNEASHPFTLLVNGRGNVEVQYFFVKTGLRYRFRLIYAAGNQGCPIKITISKHILVVVALDGHPVNPYEASAIIFGKGERVDFVLKANQPIGSYTMHINSQCHVNATAKINYVDNGDIYKHKERDVSPRVFRTDICGAELGRICLGDVQSLFVMPAALRVEKVDTKLHFAFDHLTIGEYGSDEAYSRISRMNNVSFTFPSSPLLTQFDDVTASMLCNDQEMSERCETDDVCQCVNIQQVPLDNSVEIILIDNGGDKENIFHLHGYSFYVVGTRVFSQAVSVDTIKALDNQGELFKRNLLSPARKDTIRIEKYGVVALRFIANNPGYWMLRDELSSHWTRGLDMILQVGTRRDLHMPPSDFPKCGSWVGPEFFLA